MKVWERKGYVVEEVAFDGDLHAFDVVKGEEVVATIIPASIEDMNSIVEDLDAGEDVNGWEDGMGNVIFIEKDEEQEVKYFKNVNTRVILKENEYKELLVREYTAIWEDQRHPADDFETKEDFINYMLENDEDADFVEVDKDGNHLEMA